MPSALEQFVAWRKRRGFNQAEAADFFGWHFTYINKVERGKLIPNLSKLVKIERASGIPVSAWVTTEVDTEPVAVAVAADNITRHK